MAEPIAVVGNGYVGTVVAACLASVGHRVVGLEIDKHKLELLSGGQAPFFEAGLNDLLRQGLCSRRLSFTGDAREAMVASDVAFFCVDTPQGAHGRPDLRAIECAATTVGAALDHHHVLVVKSTMPIGSARWIATIVEEAMPDGRCGEPSFAVVSNPEFLREGSAVADFLHPDRVVIGSDDADAIETVADIYRPVIERGWPRGNGNRPPVVRTSLPTAETTKYASNAYLATKLSFINELANICERVGADVTEVATAVGLDPRIGECFLDAGIGWGGSCFGKDLAALIATAREVGYDPLLLRATVAVNQKQRALVIDKLRLHLKTLAGQRVALLGLAFKPGTDDLRDAPSTSIADELVRSGALVSAWDPVVRMLPELPEVRLAGSEYDAADGADAVVLVTEWPEFVALDLSALHVRMRGNLFIDGRNLFDPRAVEEAGLHFEGVGRSPAVVRERLPS